MNILNNILKFNFISIFVFTLFLFSCKNEIQRYQLIDNSTRFDTTTGEVESLQKSGEWLSKKDVIEKNNNFLRSNLEQHEYQPVKEMVYFLY